jgi:hypothetical protein
MKRLKPLRVAACVAFQALLIFGNKNGSTCPNLQPLESSQSLSYLLSPRT